MVFQSCYFKASHHIRIQIEIVKWLQTKISPSLQQTQHFQKVSSCSQNSPTSPLAILSAFLNIFKTAFCIANIFEFQIYQMLNVIIKDTLETFNDFKTNNKYSESLFNTLYIEIKHKC